MSVFLPIKPKRIWQPCQFRNPRNETRGRKHLYAGVQDAAQSRGILASYEKLSSHDMLERAAEYIFRLWIFSLQAKNQQ